MGKLLREPPVAIPSIAPIYIGFFNEQSEYTFEFADPLAIAIKEGTSSSVIEGLVPSGIEIKLVSTTLPYLTT